MPLALALIPPPLLPLLLPLPRPRSAGKLLLPGGTDDDLETFLENAPVPFKNAPLFPRDPTESELTEKVSAMVLVVPAEEDEGGWLSSS